MKWWRPHSRFGRRPSRKPLIPSRRPSVMPLGARWTKWALGWKNFLTNGSKAAPNSSCELGITGCFTNSMSTKAASISTMSVTGGTFTGGTENSLPSRPPGARTDCGNSSPDCSAFDRRLHREARGAATCEGGRVPQASVGLRFTAPRVRPLRHGVIKRTEGKNVRTRRGSRVSKGRCATVCSGRKIDDTFPFLEFPARKRNKCKSFGSCDFLCLFVAIHSAGHSPDCSASGLSNQRICGIQR